MKILNFKKGSPRIAFWLLYPLGIFYMEIVLNLYCFRSLIPMGVVYMLLFSAVIGIICTLIVSLIKKEKAKKIVAIILMFIFTLLMMTQAVYFTIFKTFTSLSSVNKAGGVLSEFWKEALLGILKTLPMLILLAVPFALLLILWKKQNFCGKISIKAKILLLVIAITLQTLTTVWVVFNNNGVISFRYVYETVESPELTVPRFGMLTNLRLEIRESLKKDTGIELDAEEILGEDILPPDSSEVEYVEPVVPEDKEEEPVEIVYEPNVMEIDFDALIANEENPDIAEMHQYFKNLEPTMQNEYTGMFEGKNLIWIVAESFSSLALDETHTPTLTKMANEGFVFNNFYNPVWGVSTSDGEYVTLNSLVPQSGTWSFSDSSDNLMYFSMGHRLGELGYDTYAYHNHTYTYYERHLSHPNMGYDYKGIGNGLNVKEQWPESDLEMIEVTTPEYVNNDPFHVYYLTVSGHMNYNFYGNMMCAKHEEEVADLPYSEGPRAYIACNMEFDQAMEKLIADLEAAGKLEDTVIVISGDHYPYGLDDAQLEELNGAPFEDKFELYRSTLIIWNSEMERVEVDKYCSSLDILPTLCNLFGVEYDSRLMMGTDILSDSAPLVMLKDMSFITEYGRYDSSTDTFTETADIDLPENYAAGVFSLVSDKFEYSELVLTEDYYRILFEKE